MANARPDGGELDSYTISGASTVVVRAGDCVLIRPADIDEPFNIARIEKIEAASDDRNGVNVHLRRYYRAEDTIRGRRQYQSAKEVFLSDHYDVQGAHTIVGQCWVHSFGDYRQLEDITEEDFYCRFRYMTATGRFTPHKIQLYCKCKTPKNPDDFTVQCKECEGWFHPACVEMTTEDAKKLESFLCSSCSYRTDFSGKDIKKLQGLSLAKRNHQSFLDRKTRAFVANARLGESVLDFYTIRGTNEVVRAGDCVLMRLPDDNKPFNIACIEKMEVVDYRNGVNVWLRWYYLLEDTICGQRKSQSTKELFLSDHHDVQSADNIEGKCRVHSFSDYKKLENVGQEDYYCRFRYCKCKVPKYPHDIMLQCEECKDWFHPPCVGMTIKEAKKLESFLCSDCSDSFGCSNFSEKDIKKLQGLSMGGGNHQSFLDRETRVLDFYAISGTSKVVRVGDCVLICPPDNNKRSYIARVKNIRADDLNNVSVWLRQYCQPEDSIGGRHSFHGKKELFLTDQYDVQSAHSIEGKFTVHSLREYRKLDNVGEDDYYCRFEYRVDTGTFTPERINVYCNCGMPYNPDHFMAKCKGCKDWFHPACVKMTIEEVKKLNHFLCSECSNKRLKKLKS